MQAFILHVMTNILFLLTREEKMPKPSSVNFGHLKVKVYRDTHFQSRKSSIYEYHYRSITQHYGHDAFSQNPKNCCFLGYIFCTAPGVI